MGNRPTIALRVDKAQKDKWESHADTNPEYDSLSHLLRVAVAHEMSDQYGPLSQAGGSGAGQELGELVTTVDKVERRLGEVEEAIDDATRAMNTGGGVSEETLTTVYNALPRGSGGQPTTAEGIAEGLNVDSDTVRVALEQLHETTAAVRKQEIQQLEEVDGTTTITTKDGRELEIEDSGTAIRRRNPLWYRRD